jgi:hypothetical protein
MERRVLVVFAALATAVGCSQPAAPTAPPANGANRMGKVKQEIPLSGFDPKGEPVIRAMADGSLYVVFNFMPPSYVPDEDGLGPFEDFDKQLELAAGVPVEWEDREFFLIRQPAPGTIERVRRFIEGYRRK